MGRKIIILAGVVLIASKLANVIDWSWWIIISFLWGGLILNTVIVVLYTERYHKDTPKNIITKSHDDDISPIELKYKLKKRKN